MNGVSLEFSTLSAGGAFGTTRIRSKECSLRFSGIPDTPLYKSYAEVAPRPQDFPRLLDARDEFMRQPYDW